LYQPHEPPPFFYLILGSGYEVVQGNASFSLRPAIAKKAIWKTCDTTAGEPRSLWLRLTQDELRDAQALFRSYGH